MSICIMYMYILCLYVYMYIVSHYSGRECPWFSPPAWPHTGVTCGHRWSPEPTLSEAQEEENIHLSNRQ